MTRRDSGLTWMLLFICGLLIMLAASRYSWPVREWAREMGVL